MAAKDELKVKSDDQLQQQLLELKRELAAARTDARKLHEKIDGAKARLEGLMSRLPG